MAPDLANLPMRIEGGESGVPKGADRLQIATEAAVPGKVAPGLKAEA